MCMIDDINCELVSSCQYINNSLQMMMCKQKMNVRYLSISVSCMKIDFILLYNSELNTLSRQVQLISTNKLPTDTFGFVN